MLDQKLQLILTSQNTDLIQIINQPYISDKASSVESMDVEASDMTDGKTTSTDSLTDSSDQDKTKSDEGSQFVKPTLSFIPKKSEHTKQQTDIHKNLNTPSTEEKPLGSDKSAEKNAVNVNISYTEPTWSGKPEDDYNFEVLKNGSIISSVPLSSKAFHVFGRLPSCDVTLEHPSLSRHHAVVQYSCISTETHEKGWYVYDLDSTHGTWVNKKKITPKVYHRLKVGYILKFGGSSRLHILQGPSEDADEESEMTITEQKEQRERLVREAELLRHAELQEKLDRMEEDKKVLEDRGCGWGMTDDAEEVEGENPFASLVPENESLYIDDPKKALKGFYDREGCDLPDYQFTDVGHGKHKCVLDLPVDGPNGEDLVAEVTVSGKRKDAVIACALEACRLLDKFGLLRASTHESRKRKQKRWEDDDFYDSDEDTFLDRTGTIEKKRFQRMKKAGKDEAETYESLLEKYNKVVEQIQEIESRLLKAKADAEALASEEMDELDAYMISIKSGAMDTKTRLRLKGDLMRLKTEEQKLRKLVNIAKPASLPPLNPPQTQPVTSTNPTAATSSENLTKRLNTQQRQHQHKPKFTKSTVPIELKPDDYEEVEDDEEDTDATKEANVESVDRRLKDEQDVPSPKARQETRDLSTKINSSRRDSKSAKPLIKGPSLPPPSEKPNKRKDISKSFSSTASVLENIERQQKAAGYDSSNPDYASWLPPEGQTGDGLTDLNKKLGY